MRNLIRNLATMLIIIAAILLAHAIPEFLVAITPEWMMPFIALGAILLMLRALLWVIDQWIEGDR